MPAVHVNESREMPVFEVECEVCGLQEVKAAYKLVEEGWNLGVQEHEEEFTTDSFALCQEHSTDEKLEEHSLATAKSGTNSGDAGE